MEKERKRDRRKERMCWRGGEEVRVEKFRRERETER